MDNNKRTIEDLENQIAELKKQLELLQMNFTFQIEEREKRAAELVEAKEKAEESEKKFKLLYENAPLSYQSLDTNACLIDVNATWLHTLGYKREEVIGRPFSDFMTSESAELIKERFLAFVKKGVEHNYEFEMVRKDGTRFMVSYNGKIGYDELGHFNRTHCIFTDITSRMLAENELLEANQFNQQIINSANEGIIVYDKDLKYQVWNPFMEELSGIPAADVLGKHPLDLFPFLEREGVISDVEKVLKGITDKVKEFPFNMPITGKKGWASDSRAPLYNYKGEIIGVITTVRDITESKEFEIELLKTKGKAEESESNIMAIIENTFDSIWSINTNYEIQYVNAVFANAFYDSFGVKLCKGVNLLQALPDFLKPLWKERYDRTLNNEHFVFEDKIEFGHTQIYIEVAMNPILVEGKVTGASFYGKDITERKQAELELTTAKEKAEERKYQVDAMLNAIPDLVFKIDTAGVFIDYKADIKDLYYQKDSIIGKKYSDLLPPYTADIINSHLKLAFESGLIQTFKYNLELPSIGKREYEARMLLSGTNEVTTIVRDITEQKKNEIELIAAKEKAEESDRLKSAFLANMSHEIRTPMNGILGFSDLLKTPNLSEEMQQKYLRVIERSGKRMLNIIDDIISISKIESGVMEVNLKESNINEQMNYINTFFKPEAETKGIVLSFKNSLLLKEVIVKTDHDKLFAILTNLVKNAIKYSNKGSIEFGYTVKSKQLEFYVKDTGIGVDKDRQSAIFERFIQADISDKSALQGAGLGLSISKAYVEMLGGKIWIESEKGKGAIFYFTLPYNIETKGKSKSIIDNTVNKLETPLKKLNILIVDDEETSSWLLGELLENLVKKVLYAENGLEAIEICRNSPDIDLILMDIKMPVMDGYEATRQIRQFNKKSFIIAQTAFALEGDREKVIDAGCDAYLTKPIIRNELISLIKERFVN